MDGEAAKRLICLSLGIDDIDKVFIDFQDNPIGSASIGQVHKAKLKINGSEVAIKLKSPGAENLFQTDVRTAKSFCELFVPEQVALFDEVEKQFLTEFDYEEEAKQATQIKFNMRKFKQVVVPLVYQELCSRDVLTMEFLKGPKLVDGIRENARRYAATQGQTLAELERETKESFRKQGLPPVYNGPSATILSLYRTLILVHDYIFNVPIWTLNKTMLPLVKVLSLGSMVYPEIQYQESFIPLNSSFIMETLLEVHAHQLLVDGYFNADCHPGNFLLLPDGRIGMIDFGQIKKLRQEECVLLSKIVVAIASKDRENIVRLFKETGYSSKYMV